MARSAHVLLIVVLTGLMAWTTSARASGGSTMGTGAAAPAPTSGDLASGPAVPRTTSGAIGRRPPPLPQKPASGIDATGGLSAQGGTTGQGP